MRTLTEVRGKLSELHGALDQAVRFLFKAQGEIAGLNVTVGNILGEKPPAKQAKRRARMNGETQPNGSDKAMQGQEAAIATRKRGWPKGMKRGPRKAKLASDQQETMPNQQVNPDLPETLSAALED